MERREKQKPKQEKKPNQRQKKKQNQKQDQKRRAAGKPKAARVVLLSGGNPQIAKADGDAAVQSYIAAMPGWKSAVGRRIDALVVRGAPTVRKAVRWNSPFYGIAGRGWFLSFHCFTRYLKIGFLYGASLKPPPPGASKDPNMRYLDIHENEPIDEAQFTDWVRQASRLPGWAGF